MSDLNYLWKVKKTILFLIGVFYMLAKANAQTGFENMVELTGVVMSSDSLRYLPFVTVSIPSKNNGTMSSEKGVFTLIAEKGDTVEFTCMGYRKKRYVLHRVI